MIYLHKGINMIKIIELLPKGKCIGECECGAIKQFCTYNVKSGKSKTCGCSQKRNDVPHAVRRTFSLMKYRCETETSTDYKNWGAKGVKVLYKDDKEFYNDVGDKPSSKHSIDRIDNEKHYEVGNCRWATSKEQSNNLSSNRKIKYNGVVRNMTEWAELYNIKPTTLRERLCRGWDIDKALTTKVETKFYRKAS